MALSKSHVDITSISFLLFFSFFSSGRTVSLLSIEPLHFNDTGIYHCFAYNNYGDDSDGTVIIITGKTCLWEYLMAFPSISKIAVESLLSTQTEPSCPEHWTYVNIDRQTYPRWPIKVAMSK